MDEALRTSETYERNAAAYREKYLSDSVAAEHGDPFLDALDGDRVLDVGCGPGSDAATFADEDLDVTGVDVTKSFLAAADEHVDAAFCRGDMRHLPFAANTFDGVWSCAAVHHVPKPAAASALAEFARVLRDDGTLFCSVKRGADAGFEPDDDHGGGDDRFFAYYGGDEFRALLRDAGLDGELLTGEDWVSVLAHPV